MPCRHIIYPNKISTDINALQWIAENTNLTKNDLRVFIFLSCKMGSSHLVKIDKKRIAKSLDISKKDVDKSLTHLEDLCIIESRKDDHVKNGYRMSYIDYFDEPSR